MDSQSLTVTYPKVPFSVVDWSTLTAAASQDSSKLIARKSVSSVTSTRYHAPRTRVSNVPQRKPDGECCAAVMAAVAGCCEFTQPVSGRPTAEDSTIAWRGVPRQLNRQCVAITAAYLDSGRYGNLQYCCGFFDVTTAAAASIANVLLAE